MFKKTTSKSTFYSTITVVFCRLYNTSHFWPKTLVLFFSSHYLAMSSPLSHPLRGFSHLSVSNCRLIHYSCSIFFFFFFSIGIQSLPPSLYHKKSWRAFPPLSAVSRRRPPSQTYAGVERQSVSSSIIRLGGPSRCESVRSAAISAPPRLLLPQIRGWTRRGFDLICAALNHKL